MNVALAEVDTPAGPVVARYTQRWPFALAFLDAGVLVASCALVEGSLEAPRCAVAVLFWIAVFASLGRYRASLAAQPRDEIYFTAVALTFGAVPQLALYPLLHEAMLPPIMLARVFGVGLVLLSAERVVAAVVYRRSVAVRNRGLANIHELRSDITPSIDSLAVCSLPGRACKRAIDLAIALPALVLLGPVLLVAALAVVLDSKGPALYRQQRVGRDGRVFLILKFRSMHVTSASGAKEEWARVGDARITRVGRLIRRLSIDELPQLVNVALGDMSMVGPRPEMTQYVEEFRQSLTAYDLRHLVRPGLTGWSQVSMKRVLTPEDAEETLRHDLFYIAHWSPYFDLSIILKTAVEFLFHASA